MEPNANIKLSAKDSAKTSACNDKHHECIWRFFPCQATLVLQIRKASKKIQDVFQTRRFSTKLLSGSYFLSIWKNEKKSFRPYFPMDAHIIFAYHLILAQLRTINVFVAWEEQPRQKFTRKESFIRVGACWWSPWSSCFFLENYISDACRKL